MCNFLLIGYYNGYIIYYDGRPESKDTKNTKNTKTVLLKIIG